MKVLSSEKMAGIRKAFHRAGYTRTGILERLRARDFPSLRSSDIPILLHRTASGDALDTLIRLFLVEAPCDTDAVSEAASLPVLDWVEAGLVTVDGDRLRPAVKILPYGDSIYAFDLTGAYGREGSADFVMGIGASTITLANLTIRRPSRLTLDLGTGCGFQALCAAQHSEKIVATDINARAIAYARFNAALNGVGAVEFRQGDLFEPVSGLAFDLIVSNPPFVISPETLFTYCDGGMEGDALCRRLVREAPSFLAEGGFCQILCNWAEYDARDWREGLKNWVEGSGCDAWVMRSQSRDIVSYASTWIRQKSPDPQGIPNDRFEQWMRYYDHLGISSVGSGIITLRRRTDGHSWYRADDAPEKMLGPCGDDILRGFALRDVLESASDADLLETRLVLSPDARLERICTPSEGGWRDTSLSLSLACGLPYTGSIDPVMANFLVACNGTRRLRQVLQDSVPGMDPPSDAVIEAFMNIVRSLMEREFLLPAAGGECRS
ncbi:MAG TPA: methyltransferase [Deltaproteobacteria bacterium]|nr:methyltransferase [Deltaproteobacteria bacterium]